MVTLICDKLDLITVDEWQLRQDNKEIPTYVHIESFLSKLVSVIEAGLISNKHVVEKCSRSKNHITSSKALFIRASNNNIRTELHNIYGCEKFRNMFIKDRRN